MATLELMYLEYIPNMFQTVYYMYYLCHYHCLCCRKM